MPMLCCTKIVFWLCARSGKCPEVCNVPWPGASIWRRLNPFHIRSCPLQRFQPTYLRQAVRLLPFHHNWDTKLTCGSKLERCQVCREDSGLSLPNSLRPDTSSSEAIISVRDARLRTCGERWAVLWTHSTESSQWVVVAWINTCTASKLPPSTYTHIIISPRRTHSHMLIIFLPYTNNHIDLWHRRLAWANRTFRVLNRLTWHHRT